MRVQTSVERLDRLAAHCLTVPRVAAAFLAVYCLLGVLLPARTAARYLIEAENMQVDGKTWKAVDHFSWYQGAPSHGRLLRGSEGGAGLARQSLTVATGGAYRLWVRYLDTAYRGPFAVTVTQQDRVAGEQTYDVDSIRATDEGKKRWGARGNVFVWVSFPVTLDAGAVAISLGKVAPLSTSWLARHIDCLLLTDDLAYTPKLEDFVDPLYVRVAMGPRQQEPCIIHLAGRRPRAEPSWWIAQTNLYANRMAVNQCATGFKPGTVPAGFLTANAATGWYNIAPLLDGVGDNAVQFYAMQEYRGGTPLPSADFTLTFSTTPSEEGTIARFSRSGRGGGLLVRINLANPRAMQSDRELSQPEADAAAKLPPVAGKRPVRFPLMTGCAVPGGFFQDVTLNNELSVMTALGFNGIDGHDPQYLAHGFTRQRSGATIWGAWRNGCMAAPDRERIRARVQEMADGVIARKQTASTFAYAFVDEPTSMPISHIVACPTCAAAFRDYLNSQGVQPADVGKTTWDAVAPVAEGTASPELYYHTVNFRCQLISSFFKIGTDALRERIPDAGATANFAEALTFNGNGLAEGIDWFMIMGQRALTCGWTEDWLGSSTSYQLCGFRADFLRAACRELPFAMYDILRSPWDTAAKAAAEIGHGAQALHFYDYGPEWSMSGAGSSKRFEIYPGLRALTHGLGSVEDYLVGARVPASKIGLLYTRTTDIWTLDQAHSTFGKERLGLYLLLRHLGYPVDILTEDDAAAGRLAGYQAIFLTGSHLRRAAARALLPWVEGGGRLYYNAGSLTRDEYNRPLQLDGGLGIPRGAFEEKQNVGREQYEVPALKNLAPIAAGGATLESLCGIQKVEGAVAGARVAATFADGSPAALSKPLGKGFLLYCGAFPGIAYLKSGVAAANAAKEQLAAGKTPATTYNPPAYAAGYRAVMADLLAGLPYRPSLTASDYLVEANLLEHPKGRVVTLSNWSGRPLRGVTVSLPATARDGAPFAAFGAVAARRDAGNRLTLTLDVQAADMIVIPYAR